MTKKTRIYLRVLIDDEHIVWNAKEGQKFLAFKSKNFSKNWEFCSNTVSSTFVHIIYADSILQQNRKKNKQMYKNLAFLHIQLIYWLTESNTAITQGNGILNLKDMLTLSRKQGKSVKIFGIKGLVYVYLKRIASYYYGTYSGYIILETHLQNQQKNSIPQYNKTLLPITRDILPMP